MLEPETTTSAEPEIFVAEVKAYVALTVPLPELSAKKKPVEDTLPMFSDATHMTGRDESGAFATFPYWS